MKKFIISIKHNVTILSRCLTNFGIANGLSVFLKTSFNFSDKITLNGYKKPIYLRKNSSDAQVFHDIFLNKGSEVKIDFTPQVIIDAGANVGFYTLFMLKSFPSAKFFCIEPDKENFAVLEKNLGVYENVKLYNEGVWNKETFLKVTDKFELGKWAMVVEETNDKTAIKGISFNKIVKDNSITKIDILKIDIETAEKYVFKENYSDWLKISKVLIVEIHDSLEKGCGQTFLTAIHNTFKRYDYFIQGENTVIINNDI